VLGYGDLPGGKSTHNPVPAVAAKNGSTIFDDLYLGVVTHPGCGDPAPERRIPAVFTASPRRFSFFHPQLFAHTLPRFFCSYLACRECAISRRDGWVNSRIQPRAMVVSENGRGQRLPVSRVKKNSRGDPYYGKPGVGFAARAGPFPGNASQGFISPLVRSVFPTLFGSGLRSFFPATNFLRILSTIPAVVLFFISR